MTDADGPWPGSGACLPGGVNGSGAGCPYVGGVGACGCEAVACPDECAAATCGACISDGYCGW